MKQGLAFPLWLRLLILLCGAGLCARGGFQVSERLHYLSACEHTVGVVTEHHPRPFTDQQGKLWKYSYTARVESYREGLTVRECGSDDLTKVPVGLREGFYAQEIVCDGEILHDDFWSVWGGVSVIFAIGVITLALSLLGDSLTKRNWPNQARRHAG